MGSMGIELLAVGSLQICTMARDFNHCTLHPKTDAKKGNPFLPSELYGLDLSLDSSRTKPSGDENTIRPLKEMLWTFLIYLLGIGILQIDPAIMANPTETQSLGQALV